MSAADWKRIYGWIRVHEGGFVDDPKDPGGRTNKGITQSTFDAWRDMLGQPREDVANITDSEVHRIMKSRYWDVVDGDALPSGLDYCVVDEAITSGPARAAKRLQQAIGVKEVDGIIGPVTLSRLDTYLNTHDLEELISTLCEDRLAWMKRLKAWSDFGDGWTRRVMGKFDGAQDDDTGVVDRAILLSRNADIISAPKDAAPGKAEGPEKPTAHLGDLVTNPNALQGFFALLTAIFTARLEGPLAWAVAGSMVLVVLFSMFMLLKKQRVI